MNNPDLTRCLEKRVLVFGDFMVDEYVIGDVDRISPEAPIPVLRICERRKRLGGAGNVVANLVSLGARVRAFGCVGNDGAGQWLADELRELGVDIASLKLFDNVSTTVKTRFVSRGQQFLRCDDERLLDDSAIASMHDSVDYCAMLNGIDVVLISDYAKGMVNKTLCQELIASAIGQSIPIVVDPKGLDYSKYRNATVCTPNRKELTDFAGFAIREERDESAAAQALLEECGFEYVLLTRSERGISLFSKDGKRSNYPAQKKEVVDVSGAGDTVACIIALGYAAGFELEDACKLANTAAAIACSKFGTSTVSMAELSAVLRGGFSAKLVSLAEAKEIVASLRDFGKRIVFTNGCFDLLHYGHITSFEQAREQGDVLFVAVNSDVSIRRIKGENRPIIAEHDRLGLISALSCVDYVLLMDDDDPEAIIAELKPDVIVKGKDWEATGVPEARIVESYGGSVKYIDMAAGLSTTNIIDRVVSRYGKTD